MEFRIFIILFYCFSLLADDFIVGTTTAYAPFVSLSEKGEYEGYDIDVAKALSQKLKKNLVIKDLGSMPSLLLALKQEKVDAVIWAVSITEKRKKQMEMIYYQGKKITTMPLVFWGEIPSNITSLESFRDNSKYNICVEAGSFQETFLLSTPGLALKQVDKVSDALLEIRFKKSTATMVGTSLLPTLLKQFPNLKVLQIPLPSDQQSLGNGICLNKKNALLIQAVNQAVDELRAAGTLSSLEEKWNLVGQ